MLYKAGAPVSLKPKIVETLVALVECSGEVISKDELMDRLWQDAFVEEGNLSQKIYLLRKTLGDGVGGRPMIEMFWRRGYRFDGEIRQGRDVELLLATHTGTLVVAHEDTFDESDVARPSEYLIRPTEIASTKSPIGTITVIGGVILIFIAAAFLRSVWNAGPASNATARN